MHTEDDPRHAVGWFGRRVAALCALLALAASPARAGDEVAGTTAGLYFCQYKPTYLALGVAENGDEPPSTKFQFSFRYVLWDFRGPDDDEARPGEKNVNRCAHPRSRHRINFGYTQLSIWNLYAASAPFESNDYSPEIYYGYDTTELLGWGPLDWVTVGFEHQSNGEGGTDSRSWNRVYFQARLVWTDLFDDSPNDAFRDGFGRRLSWQARFYAKVWAIMPDTDEFVDYGRDFGHFELTGVLESRDYDWGNLGFSAELGVGDDFDRARLEIAMSWGLPFKGIWRFVPDLYGQYFVGYGESLERADEFTQAFRLGLELK